MDYNNPGLPTGEYSVNKGMLIGVVLGAGLATTYGGFAGYKMLSQPEYAQVVDVTAVTETLKTPREECRDKVVTRKKPVKDASGFFESERVLGYAVMQRGAGWGNALPEMLRNGDWNYAQFNPDMKLRAGVNQADCLACHKPLDKANYLFSNEALMTVAKR